MEVELDFLIAKYSQILKYVHYTVTKWTKHDSQHNFNTTWESERSVRADFGD